MAHPDASGRPRYPDRSPRVVRPWLDVLSHPDDHRVTAEARHGTLVVALSIWLSVAVPVLGAVASNRPAPGRDHPDTATVLHNLARCSVHWAGAQSRFRCTRRRKRLWSVSWVLTILGQPGSPPHG